MRPACVAIFFVSGFAALLYQVIWQRLLAIFSGADVYSATLIVAAFMGGLGLGSLAGGHVADRVPARTSLLLFAAAEIAVGAFGAVSATLFHDVLYAQMGPLALTPTGVAAILFVSLLWPTFFMGASLPLLARALTRHIDAAGIDIARLLGDYLAAPAVLTPRDRRDPGSEVNTDLFPKDEYDLGMSAGEPRLPRAAR
jgi:predicted membrane-bound spermidine synthase